MSKIVLNNIADLTSSTTAQTTINANSTTVQTAFDNTLSRDGTYPNTMGAGLDMNGYQILNLPTPTNNNSPVRLVDINTLTGGGTINISPLPSGGTQHQILTKNSSSNFDASWLSSINVTTITAAGNLINSGAVTNVLGTSIAARNLCVGSNFVAAQPYVFNILDNQAPADSRRMFFGFDDLTRPVNGSWYVNVCGGGNPNQFIIPGGGALGYFSSEVDIGIDNSTFPVNVSTGNWFKHAISKGTGAGGVAVLIQGYASAGYTPHGATSNSGICGAQINGWSDVGGFTFGSVIGAIATADDAGGYPTSIVGLEVDTDVRHNTNGSIIGIQVISQDGSGTGPHTIAGENIAYHIDRTTGPGYQHGFTLGSSGGLFPLVASTGIIFKTIVAGSIQDGFDISNCTFSGNAFKSPGYAVTGTGAFGYIAGAGGTVTQSTNKSTGVTLNKPSGQITLNNASLAAATIVSFTFTNSIIAATDMLVLNHSSGGTAGAYTLTAQCGSGTATIAVRNSTAGSLSEAIVISYAVIKGVNS